MQTRTLGRTGLEVTQLSYGAMELRGKKVWGGRDISDEDAELILNAVLDAGINFIDTSVDYGLAEERIGRYISSRRRQFYLATKCGCNPTRVGDHIETPHLWTRQNIMSNIEGSLKRMRTDYVDILQLHNPKPEDVAAGKLVEALQEIQSQGMTRSIAISSTLPYLPEFVKMGVFDTFQIPYSCLQPEHHDAITMAAEAGAGIIIRGGIAKGGPEADVRNTQRTDLWNKAKLAELTDEATPAEIILRYTLTHPHCHTTIVGTINPVHLRSNLCAADTGPLPKDLYDRITQQVAAALKQ